MTVGVILENQFILTMRRDALDDHARAGAVAVVNANDFIAGLGLHAVFIFESHKIMPG